jgi:hypothetical protein
VPVGLVVAAEVGLAVREFMPPDALVDASCGGLGPVASLGLFPHADPEDEAAPERGPPSGLWNTEVAMFTPRVQFTVVAWWQGESDCRAPVRYACRFPATIAAWRRRFRQELPWVYVELAAIAEQEAKCNFAWTRAAQARALGLPKVARVSAIYIGEQFNIHPRTRREVGRRIFLAMLRTAYLDQGVPAAGPAVREIARSGSNLTLRYAAQTNKQDTSSATTFTISARPARNCTACCSESPFWTLDQGDQWRRAPFALRDNATVTVMSAARPVALRYAFEGFVQCTIVADFGGIAGVLPAPRAAFRGDCRLIKGVVQGMTSSSSSSLESRAVAALVSGRTPHERRLCRLAQQCAEHVRVQVGCSSSGWWPGGFVKAVREKRRVVE